MARRSVVVAGPPSGGPRRAVVVQAAPPKRDPRPRIDLAIGVIGLLLLILTVALFSLLPQDDPPLPQFEVTFQETRDEDGQVRDHFFLEGDTHDFVFPYEGGNLYEVMVAFEWTDDVPSSMPDTFEVSLVDPSGEVVMGPREFTNPQPRFDDDAALPTYQAMAARHTVRHDLALRPSTEVVTAVSHDESMEDVQVRMDQEFARGGDGDWILRVRLVEAGDCPEAGGGDIRRILTCQAETGGEGDPGNPFQVVLVTFTKYDPIVAPL
jgi:hypothetical protein